MAEFRKIPLSILNLDWERAWETQPARGTLLVYDDGQHGAMRPRLCCVRKLYKRRAFEAFVIPWSSVSGGVRGREQRVRAPAELDSMTNMGQLLDYMGKAPDELTTTCRTYCGWDVYYGDVHAVFYPYANKEYVCIEPHPDQASTAPVTPEILEPPRPPPLTLMHEG